MRFNEIDSSADTTLRPYQTDNKAKVYEFWERGQCVMLQMPTGTGKTRLFASIAKDLHKWGVANKRAVKMLFLAHRKELIDQIQETLGVKYNLANGTIAAGFYEQNKMPIQVGSVQTLNRRLFNWSKKDFDIIIVDEAHHIVADSYKKILAEYPKAKLLGVTATPYRLNGAGFTDIFEELIVSDSVSKFIKNGYLSEYDYYSIPATSTERKKIERLKIGFDGDYLESDMVNLMDNHTIRAKILESYLSYANGKKGIVYTINKAHNVNVCKQYNDNGISAMAIDSDTPKAMRDQIVEEFKQGKFQVLCNVNIFSEGFDCPDIEFVQLARPTKSLSMYLQQVGRGLRIHEGKDKTVILDNVGLYQDFGVPSARRMWRKHFKGQFVPDVELQSIGDPPEQEVRFMKEYIEGEDDINLVHSTANEQLEIDEPTKNNIEMKTIADKLKETNNIIDLLQKRGLDVQEDLLREKAMYEKMLNLSGAIKDALIPLFEGVDGERSFRIDYSPSNSVQITEIKPRRATSESQPRQTSTKKPAKKLQVTFSDGTVIKESSSAYTIAEVIKRIGWERVKALNVNGGGHDLVSDTLSDNIDYSRSQKEVADGIYVFTCTRSDKKQEQLEEISDRLNLGLKIELV